MAEEQGAAPIEVNLTPADLARSYLGHMGAEKWRKIAETENTLEFYRNYKPKPRQWVPPPGPEAGGSDYSDWYAEMYADDWDDDPDDKVDYWENKVEELRDEADELAGIFGRVVQGDPALIGRYSKLEIERREKLAEKVRKDEEFKRKTEEERNLRQMDGAQELSESLDTLFRMNHEMRQQKGPAGWYIGTKKENQIILGFFGEEPVSRQPLVRYSVNRRSERDGGGYHIEIKDWRDAQELDDHPFTNSRHMARKGNYYNFSLIGDQVSYTRSGHVIDDQEEFPREEIEASRQDFGPGRLQAVGDMTTSAVKDLSALGVSMV